MSAVGPDLPAFGDFGGGEKQGARRRDENPTVARLKAEMAGTELICGAVLAVRNGATVGGQGVDRRVFALETASALSAEGPDTPLVEGEGKEREGARRNEEEVDYWDQEFRNSLRFSDAVSGCCCRFGLWRDLFCRVCQNLRGLGGLLSFLCCHCI